jgi:hypothetical protein
MVMHSSWFVIVDRMAAIREEVAVVSFVADGPLSRLPTSVCGYICSWLDHRDYYRLYGVSHHSISFCSRHDIRCSMHSLKLIPRYHDEERLLKQIERMDRHRSLGDVYSS